MSDDPQSAAAGAVGDVASGRRPVDVRVIALGGLFVLAAMFGLYVARELLLPIALAGLLSLVLSPPVRALGRRGVPAPVAAALVLAAVLGMIVTLGYQLAGPVSEWLADAPRRLGEIEAKLRGARESLSGVSAVAEQVDQLTGGGEPVPVVEVERGGFLAFVAAQTLGVLATAAAALVLLYMLLASGELLLRKLVRVMPTFADKRRTVEIVRDIERDVSLYLMTVTVINVALGVCTAGAMYLLGMPSPLLWGVVATVFNFVPYLGAIAGVALAAAVALISFDNLLLAAAVPAVYFSLTAIEGYFVTPLILGRRLTLNPVVIVLALFFWGWMWGVAGAIIAVPMVAALKIACDHSARWRPLGELLGH